MKFPGLKGLLRKRARTRLRNMMRGYRFLKRAGQLRRVAAVKEALTATHVFSVEGNSEIFSGLDVKAAEIAVRQFLLVRLVGTGLGAALLRSIGQHNALVVYPLPRAWRKILGEHGFEVAERSSAFLWACVVALYFANGIFVVLKLAVSDARFLSHPANRSLKNHVYFDALGPGNLPSADGTDEKNDIVTWYLRWPGRASCLDTVSHNVIAAGIRESEGVAVVPVDSPLLPLFSHRLLGRFLSASAIFIGKAFFRMIAGQWWYSLMLSETAKAAHVRVQEPPLLARDYLFNNSEWIYRPLWTYEAERKGSRILFYFYSTNCDKFKCAGVYPSLAYGWQAMAWPRYVVWDEYQADFVRRAVSDAAHIDIVGPIPFNAGATVPQDIPEHAIAVFDVQPMRDAVYQPLTIDTEYYVPENANKFLLDVHAAIVNAGGVMVFKRKRNIGSLVHPSYEATIKKLQDVSSCLIVDPDISASSLIEKCYAVISTPYTSTALIGRDQGKPSIYYDPSGQCEHNDRAAHGIPVLFGVNELQAWVNEISRLGNWP